MQVAPIGGCNVEPGQRGGKGGESPGMARGRDKFIRLFKKLGWDRGGPCP